MGLELPVELGTLELRLAGLWIHITRRFMGSYTWGHKSPSMGTLAFSRAQGFSREVLGLGLRALGLGFKIYRRFEVYSYSSRVLVCNVEA